MENRKETTQKLASMFMAPFIWGKFKNLVIKNNIDRYTDQFISLISGISEGRHKILKRNQKFFRARLGPDRNINRTKEKISLPIQPYKGKEMQIPPVDKRRAGRANSKELGVLYLASDKETAIAEVRPWKGSLVSVVKFKLINDLEKIVDLTTKKNGTVPLTLWKTFEKGLDRQLLYEILWQQIDQEFAKPISPEDSEIDYKPTQLLAEAFLNKGIQGIVYKSSMSNTDGYNLVLFDEKLIKQNEKSAELKEITGINYINKTYKNSMEVWQKSLNGILQS